MIGDDLGTVGAAQIVPTAMLEEGMSEADLAKMSGPTVLSTPNTLVRNLVVDPGTVLNPSLLLPALKGASGTVRLVASKNDPNAALTVVRSDGEVHVIMPTRR